MTAEPSEFETRHDFAPLGDNLAARVERMEALFDVVVRAGLGDSSIEVAVFWSGSFAPSKGRLPVPSRDAFKKVINDFRDPTKVAEERQWELDNPDVNPGY